jgi:alpha-amylase
VTVYYKKGFSTPRIHYRPVGGSWTVAPGVAMVDAEVAGFSKITLQIGSATRVEACFNNGKGVWDSNNMKNYVFNVGNSTYYPAADGRSAGNIVAGAPK